MNKFIGLLAAMALVLWGAAPSFAKTALNEGDLDRITAAGEPTIIQVSGVEIESSGEVDFEISYEDSSSDSVAIQGGTTELAGGQENLRALVVNNLAGEVLAANALNIASTSAGVVAGSEQTNSITQSWGAVKVTDVVTVTESVTVDGEDASADGGTVTNSAFGDNVCVGICYDANSNDGEANGGTAATSPGSTALLAIAYPVYMSADLIIHVEDVSIDNTVDFNTSSTTTGESANNPDQEDVNFSVVANKGSLSSLAIEGAAQSNLAALIVNNAAGKTLVANAVNIAGGTLGTAADDGGARVRVFGAGQNIATKQSNTINQYRGTPINAPTPAVVGVATGPNATCGGVAGGISFGC